MNELLQAPSEASDQVESITKIENRRLKSVVWQHFEKIRIDGKDKAKCNYCNKFLGGEARNGTKHLHHHLDICVLKKASTSWKGGQTMLFSKVLGRGKKELACGSYNEENARRELALMIILHEYPLSIVDHIGFIRFVAAIQPLFQLPSRNTMKKEILDIYADEKQVVMKLIDTNEGRVAITSDMWTASNQKKGYMAITAHYIDGNWTLQSIILRFIYVPAPHTNDRLCNVLIGCLLDWNINTKLSTITLDNCSTNDKLQLDKLIHNGSLLHMCCSAHILNLIVKEGLRVVKEGMEKIRESVAYWTTTPKRVEKFEETAKQLRIPFNKKLTLDCPTRWNSTFKMLDIALCYKDVFFRLYTCFPTESQWEFAKDVCWRLRMFNDITEIISGSKYPTANIFFPKICEIKLVIDEWVKSPNQIIHNMEEQMLNKFKSYWSVIHDIIGVASVLDPRYKMDLLEYYFDKLYDIDCDLEISRIRQLCYDLVSEYQAKKNDGSSSRFSSFEEGNVGDNGMSDFVKFMAKKKKVRTSSMKTELDYYLEEDNLPITSDFDILSWWKTNGLKYPILQAIARDVLAIRITTVGSKSAFSADGQILSPNRSRLNHTTVEALMCTKSWIWK
uniref:AC transposase n=1 Tax=Cajanus cajan TaxID=3821 RepID=A0A151SI80_CAJCA|nr:Putative AC transposase [Cajanus cajan]